MDAATPAHLDQLADRLTAALRRDAEALAGDRSADLGALLPLVEDLVRRVAADPDDPARRRALLLALSEVETFRERLQAAHGAARRELLGAADRRLAGRAYGEARRYGGAEA